LFIYQDYQIEQDPIPDDMLKDPLSEILLDIQRLLSDVCGIGNYTDDMHIAKAAHQPSRDVCGGETHLGTTDNSFHRAAPRRGIYGNRLGIAIHRRIAAAMSIVAVGGSACAQSLSIGGNTPLTAYMANSQNSLSYGSSLDESRNDAAGAMAYPGRYALLDKQSLSLSNSSLSQGSSYDSIAYAYPTIQKGAFGVGLYRITSPSADQRDANGNITGSFQSSEMTMRAGYGNLLLPRLGWGSDVSIIQNNTANVKSGFMTAGVGVSYVGIKGISLNAAVDNVAYKTTGASDSALNPTLRIASTYNLWKDRILVGADISADPTINYHFGFQYAILDGLKLRIGRSNTISGIGLLLERWNFRFLYDVGMSALGDTQTLSISMFFGDPRSAIRESSARRYYDEARELAAQGRYADALMAMHNGHRYKEAPSEMRSFEEGLTALADAQVREMAGDNKIEVLARKGVRLFLAQKYSLARDIFMQVHTLDPKNIQIEKLLTLPGIQSGDAGKEKESALPKFTDVDPVKLKLYKCQDYFAKQQYDLALRECKEVLDIDPREVMAYVRLGSIMYALGMKKEAVESWEYAEKLDPTNADVRKAIQFMQQSGVDHKQRNPPSAEDAP
jgi:tetratricopeptide (TPR) repeat protein